MVLRSKSFKEGCRKEGIGGGGRNRMLSGGGPMSQQSPKQPMMGTPAKKIEINSNITSYERKINFEKRTEASIADKTYQFYGNRWNQSSQNKNKTGA